jgi:hypothetical protein
MARRRLFSALRAILTGWPTLFAIAYLLERPLLYWTAPLLGGEWFATVRLMLDCSVLAATGWIVGYCSRPKPLFAVLVFAATLSLRDFNPLLPIDVPWLLHLIADATHDDRYLDSLVGTAADQALLFGCLIAGAMLARPAQPKPLSVFSESPR